MIINQKKFFMNNILVCTDFSKNAYCAFHYAINLFKDENCRFLVMNSYSHKFDDVPYNIVKENKIEEKSKAEIDSITKGKELLHSIKRDDPSQTHTYEWISSELSLIKAIQNITITTKIDLIVLGNQGHTGISQFILGSNTHQVLQKIHDTSVLLIPEQLEFQTPEKIGFATDYKAHFNLNEFKLLKFISAKFNSNLDVLSVGNEENMSKKQWSNLNELKPILEEIDLTFKWLEMEEENSLAIAKHVKRESIDLLCMIKYKNKAFKFFKEPVIERINEHLRFPFLIIPSEQIK